MTASRKPKTPSMSMAVRKGVALSDIDTFCKKAGRLTLAQVVDKVTVKETLTTNGSSRTKDFSIDLAFYPRQDYQAEYDVEPSEILSAFGTKFPLILKKEIQNELKKLDQDIKSQLTEIGKGKAIRQRAGEAEDQSGENDGEEGGRKGRDDDEASEVGDGDATSAKRQRQTKEQATYDDDDEDDEDEPMGQYDDDAIEAAYASADEDSDEEDVAMADGSADDLSDQVEAIEQSFMSNFSYTKAFSFRESGCTIDLQVRESLGNCCKSIDGTSPLAVFLRHA